MKKTKEKITLTKPGAPKKWIALYGKNGIDYGIDNTDAVFDSLEAALDELREWIDDAEDARRAGESPEFRLFEATELQLNVQEEVKAKIWLDLA